ncbi:MAG TPA: condensation domain-containing protein, partial [Candidatus Nanopelagicales bacterium]|nr:condensation domain-containing protein [Candidatus Nanopelagicales bacterium]
MSIPAVPTPAGPTPAGPIPTGDPLLWPVTPLQAGLAALESLAGDATRDGYLGQSVIEVTGLLQTERLIEAIGDLIVEQPQLHAGILIEPGDGSSTAVDPVQFIDVETAPRVAVHSDDGPAAPRVAEVLQQQRGLDWRLDQPPLIRWDAVVGSDCAYLVVAAHHAVLDGWSMPLLVRELGRHYARRIGADGMGPAPLRGRYQDHLSWLGTRDVAAADAFWAAHLDHLDAGPPPWLRPSPDDHGVAEQARVELPAPAPARLAAHGLTPAALARTAWQLALDAVAGTPRTPYAMTVSTRDPEVPYAEELIGLLTDAVLVADDCAPGQPMLPAAAAGERRWRQSAPHRHVGLRGCYRALRSGEIATSLLTVESAAAADPVTAGPVRFALRSVKDATHFPVAATVRTAQDGWQVEVTADARVTAGTAERLAHAFAGFLGAAGHDRPVASADVLTAADAERLAAAQSNPGAPGAHPRLPDVFAATAAELGDRRALVADGRT